MKHHWVFPETYPENMGRCSRCGAEIKVDQGPKGGARSQYRWMPDLPWSSTKLGACPSNTSVQFGVQRIAHAFVRGIVTTKKGRFVIEINNVARCDQVMSPWDIRHKWEANPGSFTPEDASKAIY
jgi:hypothetical protein